MNECSSTNSSPVFFYNSLIAILSGKCALTTLLKYVLMRTCNLPNVLSIKYVSKTVFIPETKISVFYGVDKQ